MKAGRGYAITKVGIHRAARADKKATHKNITGINTPTVS